MAAHFTANDAQRVNCSVGDLRVVATKIWGWLHVMQIAICNHLEKTENESRLLKNSEETRDG